MHSTQHADKNIVHGVWWFRCSKRLKRRTQEMYSCGFSQSKHSAQALALSADGQRLVMVEFQRKAAGDHATGHSAWSQAQLLPSYWTVELIYTVPTVRPPDSGLPWRPLTHPRCVTLAPSPQWPANGQVRYWWENIVVSKIAFTKLFLQKLGRENRCPICTSPL